MTGFQQPIAELVMRRLALKLLIVDVEGVEVKPEPAIRCRGILADATYEKNRS